MITSQHKLEGRDANSAASPYRMNPSLSSTKVMLFMAPSYQVINNGLYPTITKEGISTDSQT